MPFDATPIAVAHQLCSHAMPVTLYRVTTMPTAPRIRLCESVEAVVQLEGGFRGKAFEPLFGRLDIRAAAVDPTPEHTFYNLGPGVLAVGDECYGGCDDMYYSLITHCPMSIEVLEPRLGNRQVRVLNPLRFFPHPKLGKVPLVYAAWTPLFRVEGEDPLEIYCLTGLSLPLNEFRLICEHHQFAGLRFEPVWLEE